MTPEEFQKTFNVSRETLDRFQIYEDLLKKWQKKINLVAPSTVNDIWMRHFADSAQLYNYIDANDDIADIGAGAGFPGMVLAIMGHKKITLIESDQRKCIFLKEVARQTDVDVEIINRRIEDVDRKFDLVTARALADLDALLGFADHLSLNGKALFLKGQKADNEIASAEKNWQFDLETENSRTDDQASILKISNIKCFT